MRDDIIGVLKNALQRGESIDVAARSLINSGYSASEVDTGVRELTGGSLSNLTPNQNLNNNQNISNIPNQINPPTNTPNERKSLPQTLKADTIKPNNKPPGSNVAKIISLTSILIVLIFLLIITILYRSKIVDFIRGLI